MILLVVYDRSARKALEIREFFGSERDEALRARWAAEEHHRQNPDVEVVTISSNSRKTIERMHSRYFREARR